MEFRYRSGKERPRSFRPSSSPAPPDGFFGPQSLPGGFGMGGEIGRAGDMIFHQASALASLRRELQKERIREEIIAQEIEERRVLEAEVRRELEMERAMGIRHIPLVDQLMLNSVPAERMLVEQFVPGSVGGVPEAGIVEGSPHQVNPNVIVGKELALVNHDGGLKNGKQVGKELALVHHDGDIKNDKLPAIEVKSFQSNLFGIKRKGEAPAAVVAKSKVARSDQQSWNCALCQVSTTSETGLKAHLQGKKHQATVTRLGNRDTSRANKSGGSFVSMPKNTSLLKSVANSAQGGSTYRPQKVSIMVDGKVHYVIQKKTHMWCGACKVRCNSTSVMVEHLSGKRHAARIEELSNDRKPVITTAATTSAEAVEKELACIETTAEEEDMSMAASLVEEVKVEYESSTAGEAGDEPVAREAGDEPVGVIC